MAAEEDHALPDTRSADPHAGPSQPSLQRTPAATREEPGIQHQEEDEPRPPQQARPTHSHHPSPTTTTAQLTKSHPFYSILPCPKKQTPH